MAVVCFGVLAVSDSFAQRVVEVEQRSHRGSDLQHDATGDRLVAPEGPYHGAVDVQFPVRVTLRPLPSGSYAIGDDFTYELELELVGGRPLALPVSPEGERFRSSMSRARVATVFLHAQAPGLGQRSVGPLFLYGADDVPNSLLTLNPGESVVLRVSADWWRGALLDLPPDWSAEMVTVTARIGLSLANGPNHVPVQSENALPIELTRRE